ncbi:MAG: xylose isomerase, partial [Pseudomonadota bacterium]
IIPNNRKHTDTGLVPGGLNIDAKVRRQSIDPQDMFHGHVGAMDVCARALLMAERMLLDGDLERAREQRYAGWSGDFGQAVLRGDCSLHSLAERSLQRNADTAPVSGRQEYLENLVNRAAR